MRSVDATSCTNEPKVEPRSFTADIASTASLKLATEIASVAQNLGHRRAESRITNMLLQQLALDRLMMLIDPWRWVGFERSCRRGTFHLPSLCDCLSIARFDHEARARCFSLPSLRDSGACAGWRQAIRRPTQVCRRKASKTAFLEIVSAVFDNPFLFVRLRNRRTRSCCLAAASYSNCVGSP